MLVVFGIKILMKAFNSVRERGDLSLFSPRDRYLDRAVHLLNKIGKQTETEVGTFKENDFGLGLLKVNPYQRLEKEKTYISISMLVCPRYGVAIPQVDNLTVSTETWKSLSVGLNALYKQFRASFLRAHKKFTSEEQELCERFEKLLAEVGVFEMRENQDKNSSYHIK